jgi:hypothetical protein
MRFISLYKPAIDGLPPSPERIAKIGGLIDEMVKAGVLLATEGFEPSPKDVRVRLAEAKFTVTDGPFTEAKEIIGGFALLEAKSREDAIEHAKRFLDVMGGGECEIHQLSAAPDLPLEKVRSS